MDEPLTLDWLLANPWLKVTLDCTGTWCGAGNTSEVCRFCGYVRDDNPRRQEEYDRFSHEADCRLSANSR